MWWANLGLLPSILLRASLPSPRPEIIVGSCVIPSQRVSVVGEEVLVPLAEFADAIGLKAQVAGDKAEVKGWRGTVRLRADSKRAVVGREEVVLPVPPRSRGGRFLIPVFSLSRLLGLFPHWDAERKRVWVSPCLYKVEVNPILDGAEVKIFLTAPAKAEAKPLPDGRFVVDIFPAAYDVPAKGQVIYSANSFRVRGAQFTSCPDVARIVVDLPPGASATMMGPGEGTAFKIVVKGIGPIPSPTMPMQAVVGVEVGRETVTVRTTGRVRWTATLWRSPLAAVVDIWPARSAVSGEHPGVGPIKRVKVLDLESPPSTVRVIIELAERMTPFVLPSPDGRALSISLRPSSVRPSRRVPTGRFSVVIDPGHGGRDPGAMGPSGVEEKTLNLDIALRVAASLRARGIKVILTRTGDFYVSLEQRCKVANSSRAHCFVSIHCNAYPVPGAKRGVEVYYYHQRSLPLARAIHARLVKALGIPDGGIRRRRFYVIRRTWIPAVLVEVAYIDHPEEEALLLNPSFRQRAAEAIAEGIVDFLLGLSR